MLKLIDNYPLKNITTLGIGGPAKKFVVVKTEQDLIEALQYAKENNLQYLIVGGSSNLLVADEGVDSLVIKNEITGITASKTSFDSFQVYVKSGTLLQNLVDYSINQGLSGLQKLAGIPGTVGGAIYGNAGAYGQSVSDHLITIKAFDPNNLLTQKLNNSDCAFNYRDSIFKKTHRIILEATFQLTKTDPKTLRDEAKCILVKRLAKYPAGIKSPGSFFKNLVAAKLPEEVLKNIPEDKIVYGKIPAGTLLEEVGAKGQLLGEIEIAPYHANLFINKGSGKAQDFYNLAKTYAKKVQEKFGITLEPEVQLINLPPF